MSSAARQDFHLSLTDNGDGYTVVARYGPHSVSGALPQTVDQFAALSEVDLALFDAQKIGHALFVELMRAPVGSLYYQARGEAGSTPLRIRFHFNPADHRTSHLMQLPWELLYDASRGPGQFLALDPQTPIVRTIDTAASAVPPTPGSIRRALIVLSNPQDWPHLDIEHDAAVIGRCLESVGRVETLHHARRDTLLRQLQNLAPQIVHIMGHGTAPTADSRGALLLEDEHGRGDPVPAETVAAMFAGIRAPQLVCLATCHSANPGQRPSTQPFGNVAAALAGIGLPTVIAMRTAVRDESAQALTTRLYQRIVDGHPVETALAEARTVLRVRPALADWAVPIMYVKDAPTAHEPPVSHLTDAPAPAAGSTFTQHNEDSTVINALGGTTTVNLPKRTGKK